MAEIARRGRALGSLLGWAAVLLAVSTASGQSQPRIPLPGTRSHGQSIDEIERSVTRPLPRVSPAPGPSAGSNPEWVPDRWVRVPGLGDVQLPGHWQHRLPSGDVLVPPLTATTPEGNLVPLPGTRVPPLAPPQAP